MRKTAAIAATKTEATTAVMAAVEAMAAKVMAGTAVVQVAAKMTGAMMTELRIAQDLLLIVKGLGSRQPRQQMRPMKEQRREVEQVLRDRQHPLEERLALNRRDL